MSLDGSLPRDHRRRPPLPSLGFAGGGPLLPGLVRHPARLASGRHLRAVRRAPAR